MTELEQEVLKTIKKGLANSISNSVSSYESPIKKLTFQVINDNYSELKSIITDELKQSISSNDFRKLIRDEFNRKLARELINTSDSICSRALNELKQSPTFKARIMLAIENVLEAIENENK